MFFFSFFFPGIETGLSSGKGVGVLLRLGWVAFGWVVVNDFYLMALLRIEVWLIELGLGNVWVGFG